MQYNKTRKFLNVLSKFARNLEKTKFMYKTIQFRPIINSQTMPIIYYVKQVFNARIYTTKNINIYHAKTKKRFQIDDTKWIYLTKHDNYHIVNNLQTF